MGRYINGSIVMPRREKIPKQFQDLIAIPMSEVLMYQEHEIGSPFVIELKAPAYDERFMDDHQHFTKSNINVCYAAPRSAGKPRNWFETQLTVSKNVRSKSGYPDKGIPFFVVTDDGVGFLAHTTSDNNKQFAAIGNELILGKWIKQRLVDEGLVEQVEDTSKDIERRGMITREMLEAYGCNALAFQRTDMRIKSPDNDMNSYEVWTLKLVWLEEEE